MLLIDLMGDIQRDLSRGAPPKKNLASPLLAIS